MIWQPTWTVLAAFNNGCFDDLTAITSTAAPAGTLGGANVWTQLVGVMSVDTHVGRQHETDRFPPGTADLVLWNGDGRYDPWNTAGPYTGLIAPGVPVQIRATVGGTTYDVFTGLIDTWSVSWDSENRSTVHCSLVDVFQVLANTNVVSGLYQAAVLADSPSDWWRLSDPAGSSVAVNAVNTAHNGTPQGSLAFGASGADPADTASSVDLSNGSSSQEGQIALPNIFGTLSGSTTVTLETWARNPNSGSQSELFVASRIDGSLFTWNIDSAGFAHFYFSDSTGSNFKRCDSVNAALAFDTNWHHLAFTLNSSGTMAMYVDGVGIATTSSSSGLIPGWIPDWRVIGGFANASGPGWAGQLQDFAVYPAGLTSTQIGTHFLSGQPPPVEASGTRVGRVLNYIGHPTNMRALDTGSSNVQAPTSPLTTTTALQYLQLIELTENGALFVNKAGQVQFISRKSLITAPRTTSQATFGDGAGETPFEPVPDLALDTLDLFDRALIQREGGTAQQWPPDPSLPKAGPRTYSQSGLLLTADLEALEYAQWEAQQLATAKNRLRSLLVHPISDPTHATVSQQVLSLNLCDRVTVNRHTLPGGGTGYSQTSLIEGISHHVDFDSGDWTVTYALTPADTQAYWVCDTSTWDTGSSPTRWAY